MDIFISISKNAALCSLWAMFLILGYFFCSPWRCQIASVNQTAAATRQCNVVKLFLNVHSYVCTLAFSKKKFFNCVMNVLLEPTCYKSWPVAKILVQLPRKPHWVICTSWTKIGKYVCFIQQVGSNMIQ